MLNSSLRGTFALVGIFTLLISFLRWLMTNVLVMAKVSIYELSWASHGVSYCHHHLWWWQYGSSLHAFNHSPPCGSVKASTFDNSITNVTLGLSLRENKRTLPDRHDRVPLEPNKPQESSFWCQQGLKLSGRQTTGWREWSCASVCSEPSHPSAK